MALAPLLLTAGAWTLVSFPLPPAVLQLPFLSGIPEAGLRAELSNIYVPTVNPWLSEVNATPPNIWKPFFVLAYTLSFIIVERVTSCHSLSTLARIFLAMLLAFIGLANEPIALMMLALWTALNVFELWTSRNLSCAWRVAAGPGLAVILLATGGGVIANLLLGTSAPGLSLDWSGNPESRNPIGSFELRQARVGVVSLGVIPVLAVAVILARRNLQVQALSVVSGAFLLSALVLHYEPFPANVTRLDGHARNFALFAFLVALADRLSEVNTIRRYTSAAVLIVLVTWPTVATPACNIGLAMVQGPQFANASSDANRSPDGLRGRYTVNRPLTTGVAAYIRTKTDVSARILSPHPTSLSVTTGRPNASGFPNYVHLHPRTGPEYEDAISYLDPTAVRRLGITYVHATNAWVNGLPNRARHWLDNPELLELLVRDGSDALYRVRPAFLNLEAKPDSASFEALRRAIPASAVVYMAPTIDPLEGARVASALSHTTLLGERPEFDLYLYAELVQKPVDGHTPDFVVAPWRFAASGSFSDMRRLLWWRNGISVYTLGDSVVPLMEIPEQPKSTITLSDLDTSNGVVSFTANFENRGAERWRSVDWVVVDANSSFWNLLLSLESDRGTLWFGGQIDANAESSSVDYQFNASTRELAVRDGDGNLTAVPSSGDDLGPGEWNLMMRLRDSEGYVHLFPLLRTTISTDGRTWYRVE